MLLLITDRIFILVRFLFGDVLAYVFLEMFLCFFQQFDRLAYVPRARFIGLFLDPLSTLAPHDSNLTLRLLIVLRVVYATMFGLVQASLILYVDLIRYGTCKIL